MRWACGSRRGIAGPAGTRTARCCSRRRKACCASRRTRRCWHSAVRAGRGSARMAAGSKSCARRVSRLHDLRPANCGFLVEWSELFPQSLRGRAAQARVALSFAGETVRGEIVITRGGLEGGAVYALSPSLREAIDAAGEAMLSVDLVPDMALDDLAKRLALPRGKHSLVELSAQGSLAVAGGDRARAGGHAGKARHARTGPMAALLKAVPVRLTATRRSHARFPVAGRRAVR